LRPAGRVHPGSILVGIAHTTPGCCRHNRTEPRAAGAALHPGMPQVCLTMECLSSTSRSRVHHDTSHRELVFGCCSPSLVTYHVVYRMPGTPAGLRIHPTPLFCLWKCRWSTSSSVSLSDCESVQERDTLACPPVAPEQIRRTRVRLCKKPRESCVFIPVVLLTRTGSCTSRPLRRTACSRVSSFIVRRTGRKSRVADYTCDLAVEQ
jgi:hypothetical protein